MLPKIVKSTFKIVVPSTGSECTFRPFTTKEEKVLFELKEGTKKNEKELMKVLLQLIETTCETPSSIQINKLTEIDVLYIFMFLRSKSVGESMEFSLNLPHTNAKNPEESCDATPIKVNVEDIKIEQSNKKLQDDIIDLGNNMKLRLKPVYVQNIVNSPNTKTEYESFINRITLSLDMLISGEEVYEFKDYSQKEIVEWVQSELTAKNIKQIKEYFDSITDKIYIDVNYKCKTCGEKIKHRIESFSDFF